MKLTDLKRGSWCYVDMGRNEPYGERYIVTNEGKIYSNLDAFKRTRDDLIELYIEIEKKGYKKVKLYDLNGKSHMRRIHRIVMESFTRHLVKPHFDDIDFPLYFTVDHIDGNCGNNNLKNLRWLSYEKNTSVKKGSYTYWSNEFMTAICELYFIERLSVSRISRILKKSQETISSFLHGDVHPGFVKDWCDKNGFEYKLDVFSKNRNWKIDQPTLLRLLNKYDHLRGR